MESLGVLSVETGVGQGSTGVGPSTDIYGRYPTIEDIMERGIFGSDRTGNRGSTEESPGSGEYGSSRLGSRASEGFGRVGGEWMGGIEPIETEPGWSVSTVFGPQ